MKRNKDQQKPSDQMMGLSQRPLKYSSADSRYSSYQDFMGGAEFNEVNVEPCAMPFETQNDFNAMNIKSGVNRKDCPHQFGMDPNRGLDKIGNLTFTPDKIVQGWVRRKGEPVS